MSGKRVVETWHAAMVTALLGTSVNHSIAPEVGGGRYEKERRGIIFIPSHEKKRNRECRTSCFVPVITSATQAAVVTGLAVDTAGLTPGGGRVGMVGSYWFIKVV